MTTPSDCDPESRDSSNVDSDSPGRISIGVLDRWLVNEPTLKDLNAIQGWVSSNPENAKLIAAFRALRVADSMLGKGGCDSARVEQALRRVHIESGVGPIKPENAGIFRQVEDKQRDTPDNAFRLESVDRISTTGPTAPSRLHQWLQRSTYSIVALAVFGAMLIGLLQSRGNTTPDRSIKVFAYATENGERATVTLPDGSRVVLNVASRLYVPADFAVGNRTVELQGEAQFTIVHRSDLPFIVNAGASKTRVLGTTFVVRNYLSDSSTTIAVQDGKVLVGSVVVAAGEAVDLASERMPQKYHAQPSQFSFANGVLTLEDMTFREAIVQLNRWYNADIRLADSTLETRGIGGSFVSGSVSDLATLLELTYNVRVHRVGRTLTLYSR